MRDIIITVLVVVNFMFAWAVYQSWQRNDRLAVYNAEMFKTTYHLNERIGTLKTQLADRSSMCERVMIDAGLLK